MKNVSRAWLSLMGVFLAITVSIQSEGALKCQKPATINTNSNYSVGSLEGIAANVRFKRDTEDTGNSPSAIKTEVPSFVGIWNCDRAKRCAGHFINSQMILTAATCILNNKYEKTPGREIDAYSKGNDALHATSTKAHPNYLLKLGSHTNYMNLAIIQLKSGSPNGEAVAFTSETMDDLVGESCQAAGWTKEPGSESYHFTTTQLTVMDLEECQRKAGIPLLGTLFCATGHADLDDSIGGGLICKDELAGVLSSVSGNIFYYSRMDSAVVRSFVNDEEEAASALAYSKLDYSPFNLCLYMILINVLINNIKPYI